MNTGPVQFFSTSNTIDSSGNLSLAGNITANGTTGLTLAGASAGILFNASGTHSLSASSGTLSLGSNLSIAQDIDIIPVGTTGTNDLGSSALPWDNLYANNIVTPLNGTGQVGYWQRASGALTPNSITDDLLIGSTSTTSAYLAVLGTAVTTGNQAQVQVGANSVTTGVGLSLLSGSLTTGKLASISATTNTLTTGNLLSIDWSPTFWATSSGNLVNINLGAMADTTGNIFNIQDNASDIFSVNPQQIVNNLPTSFNAAGDVAIAYDINFTNPTASYLKSVAPLYLQSGELFNSSDLTLRTFNKGNIIFDANEASVFNHSATVSGNVVIGTTVAPANIGNFYLTNSDNSGKAVAIINQTDTGADLFTASAAGTPKFVIDKSGNVGIGSSAPGSTLTVTGTLAVSSTSTLTGAATLTGGFDSNAASTVTNLTVDGNSGNAITISGTSFTTDFTLQNGETIDNNTNNQIALNLGTTGTLALTNGTNLTTSLTTSRTPPRAWTAGW
jgi:hypothetical protein